MSEIIKIKKDDLREQINELRDYLEDIADVEAKLENAIQVFESQKSPEVVGSIKDALDEFKKDVNKLSSERIEESINMLEVGVDTFEETDDEIGKSMEVKKEGN